jgi:hypothetical protein
MAKKVVIGLLVVACLLALGARSDTEYGRFQLVTGTVRVDLVTTVTHGLEQMGQERFEDRPACFKIDTQTGQVWVYSNQVTVATSATGRTREATFEGFKPLQ